MGVEGELKGGGVTTRLAPCLHIGFRNSQPLERGVASFRFFPTVAGPLGGVTLRFLIGIYWKPVCAG